jgi:GH24 family phage-related lysozyme (muramidase)
MVEEEGLVLERYRDAYGYWTIGWGHRLSADEIASMPTRITLERALELRRKDTERFERRVTATFLAYTSSEFDAGVILAYNVGEAAFASSKVAVRHRAKDRAGAADAFMLWNMARPSSGGPLQQDPVLTRRRWRERAIYLHGTYADPGVKSLQRELARLQFYSGAIDGVLGPKSLDGMRLAKQAIDAGRQIFTLERLV